MSRQGRMIETDTVVVGSGPGGATTARELAKRGKKVVICEAGAYHRRPSGRDGTDRRPPG
jgi:choline dehydrogenase-like flavoprotein